MFPFVFRNHLICCACFQNSKLNKKYYSGNKLVILEKRHPGISGLNFLTIFTIIYSIASKWNVSIICLFSYSMSSSPHWTPPLLKGSSFRIASAFPIYHWECSSSNLHLCIFQRCKWMDEERTNDKKGPILSLPALEKTKTWNRSKELWKMNNMLTLWIILCKKPGFLVFLNPFMDRYGSLSWLKCKSSKSFNDLDSHEKLEDLAEEHKKPGSEENKYDGKNQLSQSTRKHTSFYWGVPEIILSGKDSLLVFSKYNQNSYL